MDADEKRELEMIKIWINTDIGDDIDDAAAIALALRSPEIEILGISTAYQNTVKRKQMVLQLLEQYGRTDIPVYAGHGMPLIERTDVQAEPLQYELVKSWGAGYQDKADVEEPDEVNPSEAIAAIIETFRTNPDAYFVEMALQTNLAMAFLQAPEVMRSARIIGMGGAFQNAFPEWNIKLDPEAARIVTDYAQNLILFGLDVTKYCRLEEKQVQKIRESSSGQVNYLYEGMKIFQAKTGYPYTLHDAVCITYLVAHDTAKLKPGEYTVELHGEKTRGTMVDLSSYYTIETDSSGQKSTDDTDAKEGSNEKHFFHAVSIDRDKTMQLIWKRVYDITAE